MHAPRSRCIRLACLPLASLALLAPALAQTGQAGHSRAAGKPAVASVAQKPLSLAQVNSLPNCAANQLLLSTDTENGNFDGMSHSGTLLVVRNLGPEACRLTPIARATLLDSTGKPLGPFSATPPGARFMHPGPVVLPVALAAGAELTATLRWVASPVFQNSVCLSPATLVLTLGDLTLNTPLTGSLCGERAKGVSAELSRFAPDPVVQAR